MKICFVCLHAYPLFNPSFKHIFGGAEMRCWMLAKALSCLPEYQVSFVVLDHKQEAVETYGNVRLHAHSHYRDSQHWMNGFREEVKSNIRITGTFPFISGVKKGGLFRLLSPEYLFKLACVSLYHIWYLVMRKLQRVNDLMFYPYLLQPGKTKVYRMINADIYCSFGVNELSSEIAAFCRRYGKKFVLFTSSDYDFSEEYFSGSNLINQYASAGYLCYYAIKNAHRIIVQTVHQEKLLKERFGEDCMLMLNPIDLSGPLETSPVNERRGALWVGKSDRVKQPHLLFELARNFPDYPFTMVMNLSNPEINAEVHEQLLASRPPNIEIIEHLPFEGADQLFSQAAIFINTSRFEGFPNTFLQAGKYSVPVLSLNVDPDSFIEKYHCGVFADGKFERLIEGFSKLISDVRFAKLCSDNINLYIRQHHNLDEKIDQLDKLFQELME